MIARQMIGLALLVGAYLLLIPGLTEPVLHVTTTLDKNELANLGKEAVLGSPDIPLFLQPMVADLLNQIQVTGTVVIQDTAKSILGTAETLWQQGNSIVAVMILTFSVVIPVLKLLLVMASFGLKAVWASRVSAAMSKWSMADVYVMALIVSFMAIQASDGNSALITTEIQFESGFYYFLGYCLVSILASQLMLRTAENREPEVQKIPQAD